MNWTDEEKSGTEDGDASTRCEQSEVAPSIWEARDKCGVCNMK